MIGKAKLMRRRRKFGRCPCVGHSHCHLKSEIQRPESRATDKREQLKEVDMELETGVGAGITKEWSDDYQGFEEYDGF